MKLRNKKYLLIGIILCNLFFIPFAFAQSDPLIDNNIDINSINQKIDLLQDINSKTLNTVYWTIATFVATFVAFLGIKIFTDNIVSKNKIEQIRAENKNIIEKEFEDLNTKFSRSLEEELKSFRTEFQDKVEKSISEIKNNVKDFEDKIDIDINLQEDKWQAETSRSMAYNCRNDNDYDNAFVHSLSAAYYFKKTGNGDLAVAWINMSEKNIKEGSDKNFNLKFFENNLITINQQLQELKEMYGLRIERIEGLLNKRLKEIKEVELIPPNL